jgi:hypothetical protein
MHYTSQHTRNPNTQKAAEGKQLERSGNSAPQGISATNEHVSSKYIQSWQSGSKPPHLVHQTESNERRRADDLFGGGVHCGKPVSQLLTHNQLSATVQKQRFCGVQETEIAASKPHLKTQQSRNPIFKQEVEKLKAALAKANSTRTQYQCDYCCKVFSRSGHLARHRRQHTGERPYKCMLCSKSFFRTERLKTHYKAHLKGTSNFPVKLGIDSENAREVYSKKIICFIRYKWFFIIC